MDLVGRHVVVTGASQGIGEKLAERFAARGARVLVVARSANRLHAVAERIGGSWLAADLSVADEVDALVHRCLDQLGHIDVWVNNAGVETHDAFVHVDRDHLRTLARVNVEATMLLTRDVLPHMLQRGSGHVVQVSSVTGAVSFPGMAAYSASKAAMHNLTETLRLELTGSGVGLTLVAPGPVTTAMWDRVEDAQGWTAPALRRFRRLRFLPQVDPEDLASDVVSAVESGKAHVRPKGRFQIYHVLDNLPRRLVQASLVGVSLPPLSPTGSSQPVGTQQEPDAWAPIWATDNPPSRSWPLYTRGNIGEVFPEVVLPLTWGLFGGAAERGWRRAFEQLGLLMPGDLDPSEEMVVLGVFGGYAYINASYVRLLGVRAPGGTVEAIDLTFFGRSDAPGYRPAPGHKNLRSSARLGRTVLSLLRTDEVAGLDDDKAAVEAYRRRRPGDDASDDALLAHLHDLEPLFEDLFARHILNTFSVALVSGALTDLCTKAGHADLLVSILGGIGDVESAAPSSAMWALARAAQAVPEVAAVFDEGITGLDDQLRSLPAAADWVGRFDDFLAVFGSRGPNEWDIGSDPWQLRPELALAAIDRMRAAPDDHEPRLQAARLARERAAAVAHVAARLNAVDRMQFRRLARATALYSQARERSKTTIIAAIHSARLSQRALARGITARGGPTSGWAVCLLTPDELTAALTDPTPFTSIVEERAALHARLSALIPPFVLDGVVPDPATWENRDGTAEPLAAGVVIRGIAGCPGVARGRARVVLDAAEPGDLGPGDVLIAPITDPSWTPLFLAAEAVVVDVGATMSHAVIVSRELGIPCVVSAVGATRNIPDGALVEVDGNAGTVTVLQLP
jgi:pyruvate,water dikinase